MARTGRLLAIMALAVPLMALVTAPTPAQANYKSYAVRLVKSPPGGARFRPDLEAYLSARASAARRKNGVRGVRAGSLLRTAARAQALDMALGRYVGHSSRRGHGFTTRFAAFAGRAWGLRGENAARNRRRGPVNKAKASGLFAQWLNSSGHSHNLMQPSYRYVSTGAVQIGNHLYAVQIFYTEKSKRAKRCTTNLIC